jgi:UDP-2-acetamido-3-amino-2,3-dideoxy-glucuronate N-acetyltransferase
MNYYAHPTAIIDEGCEIGDNTKIWHYAHVMGGCKIGKDCNLGQNVFIASGVILGNNVKIQNNVSVYAGVTCEDDVFLGPSCVFTNVRNPRSHVNRRGQYTTTHIGKGATIGANATIVCGNNIGAFAFIGAGAVVTHEVVPYALIIGNPARQVGWMSEYGHRLNFDSSNKTNCPETGDTYELRDGIVTRL